MDVITAYLELCLRLGRHIDGLVDAYYGPAEISQRIDAEELREPSSLVGDAGALLAALDSEELAEPRRRWLRSQLVGLETVARRLDGQEVAYEDEVERCYGVRPKWVDETVFEAAHRELDEALPGSAPLTERYQAWREGGGLQGDELATVYEALIADFRSRTEALVGLPEGEDIEVDYVTDEPWAAFNYYLGGLRSRIAVNTDVAMTPAFVVELAAHEGYPGHHTEHAWKEQLRVREAGELEESAQMIGTPAALIAEGIAGLATEMLLGDEEQEVTAAHFAGTSVAYDPDVSRAVQKVRSPLERVSGNTALLLHTRGVSTEEATEYQMRWALTSRRRAEQGVRFMTDPVWRSYVTTYTRGYDLCHDFVDGDVERFKRLLTEQLTPADLTA
ncbi:MAG: hypothetical protein QOI67_598 [Gaiellaceae bacterium]|jgi:hypothetical protein|nr:hypothetical protein [Gaiellaceae bacterium]